MEKKRVAIIGVTGAVGQEFVQSLENHPWFEVTQIAASERPPRLSLRAGRDGPGRLPALGPELQTRPRLGGSPGHGDR